MTTHEIDGDFLSFISPPLHRCYTRCQNPEEKQGQREIVFDPYALCWQCQGEAITYILQHA
jgi:hypothetical protein